MCEIKRSHLLALILIGSLSITTGKASAATSYNIDFGSYDAAPSSAFGASAGQAGVWNRITSGGQVSLTNLAGAATSAKITVTATDFGGNEVDRTGDVGLLLNDFFFSNPGNLWSVSITGLANGNYDFYYYAPTHPAVDTGAFTVNGTTATNLTGSNNVGTGNVQGIDWQVLHNVTVTNGTMTTFWQNGGDHSYSGLSGIQIVWVNHSYNIDFGSADAAPSAAFGAAANQPGVWNQVISGSPVVLTDVTGGATSARITGTAENFTGSASVKTGDLGLLLNDNFYSSSGNPWSLSITGLVNGNYDFYYYAPPNSFVDTGAFTVNGRTATNLIGSIGSGDDQGIDWQVLHNVTVTDGTMTTFWQNGGDHSYSGLSGIQIVWVNPAPPPIIVVALSGTNLNLSWPSDNIGWRLLEQTNDLPNGISLNTNDWGTVANSANTNLISVPIDPTQPAGFFRLVSP